MRNRRLLWRLFPGYAAIIVAALLVVGWYGTQVIRDLYFEQTQVRLETVARLSEKVISDAAGGEVQELCDEFGQRTETRITVIATSGEVLADTERNPDMMDNHLGRPEIREAITGKVGTEVRFSHTLGENMMYVAVPLRKGRKVTGVVRAAVPLSELNAILRDVYAGVVEVAVVVAVLAAVVSLLVSRQLTKPLEQLREQAERFAEGDFSAKAGVTQPGEIGALAASMDEMARQLDEKMQALLRQRNEQEAVLSSITEAVMAFDTEQRVISLNPAAGELIESGVEQALGRQLQEVVRDSRLQEFVEEAAQKSEPFESGITLIRDGQQRFVMAQAASLRDGRGKRIGTVVVLNDFTEMRKLETVRRDFVANVSHELRTPITSIKAAAETLLEGGAGQGPELEKFAGMINRQSDRLNAIVDDLLTLSKVEQQREKQEVTLERGKVRDVLDSAIQVCAMAASGQDIAINLACGEDIEAGMNAALFERAVVNLIDNAIKYSKTGGCVEVAAVAGEEEVTISVTDKGCGIGTEHLERIFERFYRVDKARSRQLGGTGLGLAIVKHIVQMHGGYVTVESRVGVGSTFTIHLPVV